MQSSYFSLCLLSQEWRYKFLKTLVFQKNSDLLKKTLNKIEHHYNVTKHKHEIIILLFKVRFFVKMKV